MNEPWPYNMNNWNTDQQLQYMIAFRVAQRVNPEVWVASPPENKGE